jgi:hypothetical protein
LIGPSIEISTGSPWRTEGGERARETASREDAGSDSVICDSPSGSFSSPGTKKEAASKKREMITMRSNFIFLLYDKVLLARCEEYLLTFAE